MRPSVCWPDLARPACCAAWLKAPWPLSPLCIPFGDVAHTSIPVLVFLFPCTCHAPFACKGPQWAEQGGERKPIKLSTIAHHFAVASALPCSPRTLLHTAATAHSTLGAYPPITSAHNLAQRTHPPAPQPQSSIDQIRLMGPGCLSAGGLGVWSIPKSRL